MQTIWGYSQFRFVYNTVLGIPNLLGDHFHPILLLLGPLYRAWPSADLLFAVQAALLAAAAIPIYLLAEPRLGAFGALCLEAAYLFFWGILDGVIYDFHHVAFAVPAISWGLYAVFRRNDPLLLAMVLVGMLTREDVALTLIALGLYAALAHRRVWLGLWIAAVNVAWFAFLLGFVLPALGGTKYRHWTYEDLGQTPTAALRHIVTRPLSSLRLLVTPFQKLRLLGGLAIAWDALPLASPVVLVAVPSLLERLWSSESTLWSLHFQYSMLIAPLLAIATVDTLGRIAARYPKAVLRTAVPVAVLVSSIVTTFAGVKSLADLTTYVPASYAAAIQSCLNEVPPTASVSASNFLLPHLANRDVIYLFPPARPTRYIAVDVATYKHWAPGEEGRLRAAVNQALAAGYAPVCSRGLTLVMEKGAVPVTVTPDMRAWLNGR